MLCNKNCQGMKACIFWLMTWTSRKAQSPLDRWTKLHIYPLSVIVVLNCSTTMIAHLLKMNPSWQSSASNCNYVNSNLVSSFLLIHWASLITQVYLCQLAHQQMRRSLYALAFEKWKEWQVTSFSFSVRAATIKASTSSFARGNVLTPRSLVPGAPLTLPCRVWLRVPLAQLFIVPSLLIGDASPTLPLAKDPEGDWSPEQEGGASALSVLPAADVTKCKFLQPVYSSCTDIIHPRAANAIHCNPPNKML